MNIVSLSKCGWKHKMAREIQKEILTPEQHQVLEGELCLQTQDYWRATSASARLYIQSDLTDFHNERAALWETVFPQAQQEAIKLGLQLHIIDIYRMLREDNVLPYYTLERNGVFQIAIKEITLSHNISSGPSFITFLGQKYGHKMLQHSIPSDEYALMYSAIEDSTSKRLINKVYRQDEYSSPPQYVLQQSRESQQEWRNVHDIVCKTIRKAAKVALGKDPTKVQSYISSLSEEEITVGIFNSKQNPNKSCFWFKRTFTDMYDQRPSADSALSQYSDVTVGKRGLEFDTESVKALNYLKEARLPAKYIGLDSSNIYEFPIKWSKNKGLDVTDTVEHREYIEYLCDKVMEVTKQCLKEMAAEVEKERCTPIFHEAMLHIQHFRQQLQGAKDVYGTAMAKVHSYTTDASLSKPLVIHGTMGSGKTTTVTLIASTISKMRKKCLVLRYIGLTPSSASLKKLLASICQQVAVVYRDTTTIPSDCKLLESHLLYLMSLASQDKPLYLLLDGVDHLDPTDGALGLSWLPLQLPPHVKLIVSTSSEVEYRCYPVLRSLIIDDAYHVKVSLSDAEFNDVLSHMFSQSGCYLPPELQEVVKCTSEQENCAHLKLIVEELHHVISLSKERVESMLPHVASYEDAVNRMLDRTENKHGRLLVSLTLSLVTASQFGLSENELLDILSCDKEVLQEVNNSGWYIESEVIPPIVWSCLLHDLLPSLLMFKMAEGNVLVLQWQCRKARQIGYNRYFRTQENRLGIGRILSDYFLGNGEQGTFSDQPLVLNEGKKIYNIRKLTELPSALVAAERYDKLCEILMDCRWLCMYNELHMLDKLLHNLSYIVPNVSLDTSQSGSNELRLFRDTIRISLNVLHSNCCQISSELVGRLLPHFASQPTLRDMVLQLLTRYPSLLTPLTPSCDVPGGPLLLTMSGHQGPITSIATTVTMATVEDSPKQQPRLVILSASLDKTLRSWDWEGSGVLKTFDGHTDAVLSVSVTNDGCYAVSGGKDMTVRYWAVDTAECLYTMEGHSDTVTAVEVTSNGHKTVSGSLDGTIRVWNTAPYSKCKGEVIFTLRPGPVHSLALTKDNKLLFAGVKKGKVIAINMTSSATIQSILVDHTFPVTSIALVEQNGVKALAFCNGVLATLEGQSCQSKVESSVKIQGTMCSGNSVTSLLDLVATIDDNSVTLTLANDGDLGVTGSYSGGLSIWNLQNPPLPKTHNTHHHGNIVVLAHSSSHLTSVSSGSTEVAVWSLGGVTDPVQVVQGSDSAVSCVLHIEDTMVTGHHDGSISQWATDMMSIDGCYRGHVATVTCMAVTNDNRYLMSGDAEGNVVAWSMSEKVQVAEFTDHKLAIVGIGFPCTDTAQYILTVDGGERILVRDYQTAGMVRCIEVEREPTCLSVEGDAAAVGYGDGSVEVWHLPQGHGDVMRGHSDAVTGIHFIGGGYIVSSSTDSSIGLWSMSDHGSVSRLVVDQSITSSCLCGSILAYGCDNGYLGMVHVNTNNNNEDNPILQQLANNNAVN